MKRRKILTSLVCISLIFAVLASLGVSAGAACSAPVAAASAESSERLGVGEGASALNGKKILFAGCSYTYYGGLVERSGASVFSQERRTANETGLFARIAELNGVKDLTVTDWCYGGHDMRELFGGEPCNDGEPVCFGRVHLDDLIDRSYDIVVLQEIVTPGYTTPEEYVDSIKMVMDIFREGNPDTEFYVLAHHRIYQKPTTYNNVAASLEIAIEELGVKVIDWGALVYDVTEGNVTIPGSTIDYNYYSFVVSRTKDDGHHQNLLAGYLGAMMTYAALTGETTVGQPYEFIYDLTSKYLNIDKFIDSYYIYDNPSTERDERGTNMKEIFYSETDMRGLQVLANEYLDKSRWLDFATYTVEFRAGDEVISSEAYKWGEEIIIPDAPEKEADGEYKYTFSGWDTEPEESCRGSAAYTAVYSRTPLTFIAMIRTLLSDISNWFSKLFGTLFGK